MKMNSERLTEILENLLNEIQYYSDEKIEINNEDFEENEIIENLIDDDEQIAFSKSKTVSFQVGGYLTQDNGIVIQINGSEFQITVKQSK